MPDYITMCESDTLGTVPVLSLHPVHAQYKLAKILRDPVYAAKQFKSDVFISDRNRRAHYRAKGQRWEVQTAVPTSTPSPEGVSFVEVVPVYYSRRSDARDRRRWAKSLGFRAFMLRLDENGQAERVR